MRLDNLKASYQSFGIDTRCVLEGVLICFHCQWNLVCDNAWLKTFSESLFMMGDIPGSVICGALSDRYGRKTALLWGSIMQFILASLVVVSPNFSAFTVLRVLVGATTSSLFLVVYVMGKNLSI